MKPTYPSIEAEYIALHAEAAASWALTHRAEYDRMLLEAFPSALPRVPGEWSRRMAVLVDTCARRAGFPAWPSWVSGRSHPHQKAAA